MGQAYRKEGGTGNSEAGGGREGRGLLCWGLLCLLRAQSLGSGILPGADLR